MNDVDSSSSSSSRTTDSFQYAKTIETDPSPILSKCVMCGRMVIQNIAIDSDRSQDVSGLSAVIIIESVSWQCVKCKWGDFRVFNWQPNGQFFALFKDLIYWVNINIDSLMSHEVQAGCKLRGRHIDHHSNVLPSPIYSVNNWGQNRTE